jgi:hypothetical protein
MRQPILVPAPSPSKQRPPEGVKHGSWDVEAQSLDAGASDCGPSGSLSGARAPVSLVESTL